jgi:hypothetical protein
MRPSSNYDYEAAIFNLHSPSRLTRLGRGGAAHPDWVWITRAAGASKRFHKRERPSGLPVLCSRNAPLLKRYTAWNSQVFHIAVLALLALVPLTKYAWKRRFQEAAR